MKTKPAHEARRMAFEKACDDLLRQDRPSPVTLDDFTTRHFERWLEHTVVEEDQARVREAIYSLLADYPTLPDEGRSWPEIRMLAERR